jgi:hypothetical protein
MAINVATPSQLEMWDKCGLQMLFPALLKNKKFVITVLMETLDWALEQDLFKGCSGPGFLD